MAWSKPNEPNSTSWSDISGQTSQWSKPSTSDNASWSKVTGSTNAYSPQSKLNAKMDDTVYLMDDTVLTLNDSAFSNKAIYV